MSAETTRAILTTLADAAARSLVLGAIVATLLAVWRPKSVHARLFAWRALLCAALAMPVLIWLGPAVHVSVPLPRIAQKTSAAADVPVSAPVAPGPSNAIAAPSLSDDGVEAAQREDAPARLVPVPDVSLGSSRATGSSVPAPPTARRKISWTVSWTAIALGLYAAMAIALLVRVLIGIAFSSRLVRAAKPVDDSVALDLLSSAALASGLSECPRLAESENISVPVVIGVRQPAVLLPADDRVWEEDELAAVLLHEVSHVARRDALLQRLALIHRAMFWFSPLAWWLERHLADISEQASDEAALAGGVDRTRYAESLLGFFADLEAVPERVWWQGVSMAKTGQAAKRVDRILSWRGAMSNSAARGWKKFFAVGLVFFGLPVLLLTASLRVSAYDVQPPPPPPAAPPAPAAAPAPPIAQDPGAAPSPAAPATAPSAASPAAPASPAPQAESDDNDVNVAVAPLPPLPEVRALGPLPEVRVYVPPVNVDVPGMHVVVPPVNVNVPPVHVAVPQIRVETRLFTGQDDPNGPVVLSTNGDWNFSRGWGDGYIVGRYEDWSPRFAIVTHDSDSLTMSGDREDAEHARSLKQKYSGDFIWFEHDGKAYVTADGATVSRAKQLWQPNEELAKQQKDLGKQMHDLQKQMEDSRQKFEDAKIKLPDMTAEMQKLQDTIKQLSASGGTYRDLSDLQRQMGELQRQIAQAESSAGRDTGMWGREQGDLGRKMGDIGRQEGELGRKQAQSARDAAKQMQQLLDDAVSKGLAKPE